MCGDHVDLLRKCLLINFPELKDVLCACGVFLLCIEGFICFSLGQNDTSCSSVAGLNSWDAPLQPVPFFLGKTGGSC